jgi:predicted methyltransferase
MRLLRNAINLVKEELSNYLEPASSNTQLNSEGIKEINGLFSNKEYLKEDSLLDLLNNQKNKNIIEFLTDIKSHRPIPNRKFDQFTATIETSAKRSSLLEFMGDIEGKKILFLGDDDFTSVAVSKNGNAKELVVLDIDKRILTEIDNISAQYNLGIKTIEYDARKKLPSDFWNKYDIIFFANFSQISHSFAIYGKS